MLITTSLTGVGRLSLVAPPQVFGSIFIRQLASFKNKFYWKPYRFKANRKPKLPVILLEDNERLGRKGELVRVERGLARNVLIPENKADYATKENLEKYNVTDSSSVPRASLKMINKIGKLHLRMGRPKDESWQISKHHIAFSLERVYKLHVPVHCMETDFEAIQEFGDFTVNVTINSEATVPIKIIVEEWQPRYLDGWEEILAGEVNNSDEMQESM